MAEGRVAPAVGLASSGDGAGVARPSVDAGELPEGAASGASTVAASCQGQP
ncbi:MAG: hypothetical protein LUQ59_12425 [Methanothrix sp.]|nr:hypothetical protein [Methanothrix sp.]